VRTDPVPTWDDDPEPARPIPTGPPVQARIALGLGFGAVIVMTALSGTVAGTSALALSAVEGDPNAILLATGGFGAGVVLILAGLLTSLQPIARNHGRRTALAAAVVSLTAPITAAAVGFGLEALA